MSIQWRVVTVTCSLCVFVFQSPQHLSGESGMPVAGSGWTELRAGMDKMHEAMMSVGPSGDDDADFVRLMLPHHQAAIDMAMTELLHGKSPEMRRLAQEIITDQQSEIDLMQLWLKKHAPTREKDNMAPSGSSVQKGE